MRYLRYGASWQSIFFAFLGSAFPILLPWFVAINSLAAYPAIANGIMLIAMVLYVMIMPVLPTLANMGNIPILKTGLHACYDVTTNEVTDFSITVNPLDYRWYEKRDDEDLLESIKESVLKTFQAHLDIDTFEI
jgi:hypothetical protein